MKGIILWNTLALTFLLGVNSSGFTQTITTVAGPDNVGDYGPAILATLNDPEGTAVDGLGNTYVTEGLSHRIRKISQAGTITTIAGTGVAGFSGDGGPATSAQINYPTGIAVDGSGNVFFSDWQNNRIRKISTSGTILTVAGNGAYGFSGDGALATSASLNSAYGIGLDISGGLYIADRNNHRIRKVDANGIISTIAGTSAGFSGDGGQASTAQLNSPTGVTIDGNGNIYVSDYLNWRIRKIAPNGLITTIAGTGIRGATGDGGAASSAQIGFFAGASVDATGNVYIPDYFTSKIRKIDINGTITRVAGLPNGAGFSGDNGPADAAALSNPLQLAVDASGNLTIADRFNQRVRRVSAAGVISTLAGPNNAGLGGDGDLAIFARLNYPADVKGDGKGNFYIAELGNARVRKVDATGIITTIAGKTGSGFSGDGGPAIDALLSGVYGVLPDANGNIYIADTYNNRIRKVDAEGIISTVAGNGTSGFSGDGGAALNARLKTPYNIALDKFGNLYIADSDNNRIRRIDTNGNISTVVGTGNAGFDGDGGQAHAAQINFPTGISFDAADNMYIADNRNHRIRKVTPGGIISTIAGTGIPGYGGSNGPATFAQLSYPFGITASAVGVVFFTDNGNARVRRIGVDGVITDVAGISTRGFSGDGGLGSQAGLDTPFGLGLDDAGNLLIADAGNARVRKVACLEAPVVDIIASATKVCIGDLVVLTAIVAGNSQGYTYDWTGNTVAKSINSVELVALSGSENYLVEVRAATGCIASASITITADILHSITSGDWEDPSVWSCGRVPTSDDVAVINSGHTLTAKSDVVAKKLVLNGKLINEKGSKIAIGDFNQPKIFNNVHVINDDNISYIVSAADNSATFIFNDSTKSYKIGDVIVAGASSQTPFGLLRKILSIQENGNQITFQTESATLAEVFEQGNFQIDLSMPDISESGRTIPLREGDDDVLGFNLDYNETHIFKDFDNNPSTTDDQIRYDISLNNRIYPLLHLDFKEKYAKCQVAVSGDYSVGVHIPKIKATVSNKITVKKWCNTVNRVIPVVVLGVILPVPIVLTTVTKLNIGGEFTLDTKIANGFTVSGIPQMIVGSEYVNSDWKNLDDFRVTDFKFQPISILPEYGEFNFKPFIDLPEIEVFAYDITSINQCLQVAQTEPKPDLTVAATIDMNLSTRFNTNDVVEMCASSKATLSASLKPSIFGLKLPQYDTDVSFDLKELQCITKKSTDDVKPVVVNQQVTNQTDTEAQVHFLIQNFKAGKVLSYGICYSSSTINPTLNDTKLELPVEGVLTDSKSFVLPANYLMPRTTYVVKAFARTAKDTIYSDLLIIETLDPESLIVMTKEVLNVKSNSAKIIGEIDNYENRNFTSYGICYSDISFPPTTENAKIEYQLGEHEVPKKNFSADVVNLKYGTVYQTRAYLSNASETVYGNTLSFTTLNPDESPYFFNITIDDSIKFSIPEKNNEAYQFGSYEAESAISGLYNFWMNVSPTYFDPIGLNILHVYIDMDYRKNLEAGTYLFTDHNLASRGAIRFYCNFHFATATKLGFNDLLSRTIFGGELKIEKYEKGVIMEGTFNLPVMTDKEYFPMEINPIPNHHVSGSFRMKPGF